MFLQALHVVPARRHMGNYGQERVSRGISVDYKQHDVERPMYLQVAAKAVAEGGNEGRRAVDEATDTAQHHSGNAQ